MNYNEEIQQHLEHLAEVCLSHHGTKFDYTDHDLVNTTLILNQVLMSKMFDAHAPQCTEPQMIALTEKMGETIRDVILLFTNVDLHEAAKGKPTHLS